MGPRTNSYGYYFIWVRGVFGSCFVRRTGLPGLGVVGSGMNSSWDYWRQSGPGLCIMIMVGMGKRKRKRSISIKLNCGLLLQLEQLYNYTDVS